MKKLIAKLFIVSAMAIILFLILNFFYKNTNYWKSENFLNKFDNVPYNINIANLGSSHALYGLKYDENSNLKCWNFALQAQPYFYDYAILNKYKNHFSDNAIVIILVSYFEITGRLDYTNMRKRYYRILSKDELDQWCLRDDIIYSKIPVLSAGENIGRIIFDVKDSQMSPYYGRTKNLYEGDNLKKYCNEKYNNWISYDTVNGYNDNLLEVSRIIDLCYLNDLIPVVITMPVTNILNSFYYKDPNFFTNFERFYYDLCKKYPNLVCLDYSRNPIYTENHSLFFDGDHLNNKGAEMFTNNLIEDLDNLGILRIENE